MAKSKTKALPERDADGKFPAFAFPGAYTIIYFDVCGNILCADCASLPSMLGSEIVDYDLYDEGPDLSCDNCPAVIKSSYGDPDNPDDD